MNIPRIYDKLEKYLESGKVLIIYGPRQIGKTTLVKNFLNNTDLKYRFDIGENIKIRNILGSEDLDQLSEYVAGYDLLVIDEAQKISSIGIGLKMIVDTFPNIKIIAIGSSSFELAGQIGEPLTGRKRTLNLYPISQIEMYNLYNQNKFDLQKNLENIIIFGSYPAVLTAESKENKRILVEEITNSYLLKDIFDFEKIKGSKILLDLLRLLAFQIGNEVSLSELARQIGIDYKTVGRYLDILEKSFVIYNLRGFSKNLRKEITKKSKYYFYDTGIRNAIISNFNEIEKRNDVGGLWENFLIMERIKKQNYKNISVNNYFWRTWEGQEVDWVEEREGKLYGYEFKWSKDKIKIPKNWLESYDEASFETVNQKNYFDFVL